MAKNEPVVIPDWAAVGNTVMVRFNTRREADYRPGTVVRHTKTQIVVERPNANGEGTYTMNWAKNIWADALS